MLAPEMTHAARLALVGEITASIAHEVAQPLSAILSNLEAAELLVKQGLSNSEMLGVILADIKRDHLRACEVVRRLRLLLQKRELQFETLDVNTVVSNAATLLRGDASRRGVVLRTEFGELPEVRLDRVHFQQVVLNLLLNAMDAMEQTPPSARSIVLRTSASAPNVEVSVSDSGIGMTADQLAKAFDAFFTTKESGMGLGLSIAKSIVQAHGGTITAHSVERSGTSFRITLPMEAA
jgi:signal transduction histidine kinase